jgi:hypothetical protein
MISSGLLQRPWTHEAGVETLVIDLKTPAGDDFLVRPTGSVFFRQNDPSFADFQR